MFTFNSIPLFKLLTPFCLGIIASSYFPFFNLFVVFITVGTVILSIVAIRFHPLFRKYRNRHLYGLLVFFSLLLLGYCLPQMKNPKNQDVFFEKYRNTATPDTLLVTLSAAPSEKENSIKWMANVDAILHQNQWKTAHGKVLLYAEKQGQNLQKTYGQQLLITTYLEEIPGISNPNEFNYQRYLKHHYIFHRGYVAHENVVLIQANNGNFWVKFALETREKMLFVLRDHGISGNEYAVLSALIFGFKDHLDFEIKQAFSSAGAMHVLAVSGLHVGIILLIVSKLLHPLKQFKYGIYCKIILEIIAVWSFALLTGLSPSVIRAATMFSFISVAKGLKRNTNIYNTLAVSAFFILLVKPYMLMEVGFQLSYLAVLGILLIQPKLYQLIDVDNRILNWAWSITTVSISAQIATAPLGLLYFHQFPNYFLLSNLMVIPAAFLLVAGGVLLLITSPFSHLGEPVALLLNGTTWLLNQVVLFIEKLPSSISSQIDISTFETWIIYAAIIAFITWFYTYKRTYFLSLLGFLFFFASLQFVENRKFQNRHVFTVYSTKNNSAFSISEGTQSQFFCTSSLNNNPSSLQFNIWHHWWANDWVNTSTTLMDQFDDFTQINTPHYSLLVLKAGTPQIRESSLPLYLLVTEAAMVPTEKHPFNWVIIDQNLSWKMKKEWIDWCEFYQIPVWNTAQDGAFTQIF